MTFGWKNILVAFEKGKFCMKKPLGNLFGNGVRPFSCSLYAGLELGVHQGGVT